MPTKMSTDVGERTSILCTDLDDVSAQDERPSLKRPGHLADDDDRVTCSRELAEAGRKVRRAGWREALEAIERVEFEPERDLRPPRSVLDNEVRLEMQPARVGDRLDVLHADLSVATLPARDGRLTEPKPFRELALGEAGSPSGHPNIIAAAHTKMVSGSVDLSVDGVCNAIPHPMKPYGRLIHRKYAARARFDVPSGSCAVARRLRHASPVSARQSPHNLTTENPPNGASETRTRDFLGREQPTGREPHRERCARTIKDRACRHRGPLVALGALYRPSARSHAPVYLHPRGRRTPPATAATPRSPSSPRQSETTLELPQRPWILDASQRGRDHSPKFHSG